MTTWRFSTKSEGLGEIEVEIKSYQELAMFLRTLVLQLKIGDQLSRQCVGQGVLMVVHLTKKNLHDT